MKESSGDIRFRDGDDYQQLLSEQGKTEELCVSLKWDIDKLHNDVKFATSGFWALCVVVLLLVIMFFFMDRAFLTFESAGLFIAILSLLVTLLVGWNIISTIDAKKKIEEIRDDNKKMITSFKIQMRDAEKMRVEMDNKLNDMTHIFWATTYYLQGQSFSDSNLYNAITCYLKSIIEIIEAQKVNLNNYSGNMKIALEAILPILKHDSGMPELDAPTNSFINLEREINSHMAYISEVFSDDNPDDNNIEHEYRELCDELRRIRLGKH